jgi:HPt (histidine-containing phosphotransfer) domain-containing protein
MTPRAVLEELVRVGVVEEVGDGNLALRQRAYVPAGDSEEMLQIFGEDVSDLIATIDQNLVGNKATAQPLFQRTLVYNNIPPEVMGRWRHHAARQSQNLLEQLDEWLAPYDRDIASHGANDGQEDAVRTGVGIFYFEEPVQPEITGEPKNDH